MKCAELIGFREKGLTSNTAVCIEHDDRPTNCDVERDRDEVIVNIGCCGSCPRLILLTRETERLACNGEKESHFYDCDCP